jgi:Leucine-rich repeat (LRR) protein
LKCFDICNVELPNHIVSMILRAIRGKKLKIKGIHFEYNNFREAYGIELASWLLNHSTASHFWYEGDIHNYEFEFRPLINAITKHKSLRTVVVNTCNRIIGEENASKAGCDMLCSILESNDELKSVSFQGNGLGVPDDTIRMIDALGGCSELEYLDISNNAIAHGHGRRGGLRNEIDPDVWGSHVFSHVFKENPNLTVKIGNFNANHKIEKG